MKPCLDCSPIRPWWAKDEQTCVKCGNWPRIALPREPASISPFDRELARPWDDLFRELGRED